MVMDVVVSLSLTSNTFLRKENMIICQTTADPRAVQQNCKSSLFLPAGHYLVSVDASGHGPGGHDVVHHPLAQAFGDLVEFEEVPYAVEHLVVAVGVGVHLLKDGGDVTEDGGVKQRC